MAEPHERLEVLPAETGGVPPTEKAKPCKYCDKTFPTLGELGKHMWTPESEGGHRETMLKLQKEGLAKRTGAKAEKKAKETGEPPTPPTVYKGEPDAMSILRNILEKHPDIGEAVKEEVLDWARLQEFLSPQTLAYLLGQMRGVSSQTANIVAQKYSMALQRAQLEGRPGVQMPILPQPQPPQAPFQVPVQGYLPSQYPPFQVPPTSQAPPRPAPYAQPQPYPFTQPPYQQYPPAPPYQPPPQPQPTREQLTKEDVERMIERGREGKPITSADVERMMEADKDETVKAVRTLMREDREAREKGDLVGTIRDGQRQSQEDRKQMQDQFTKLMEKIEKGGLFPKAPPTQQQTPPPTKEEIAEMTRKAASEVAARVMEARTKEDREEREKESLTQVVKDLPAHISEVVAKTKSAEEKETLAQLVKDLPAHISEVVAKTKSAEELPKQIAEAVARAVPKPPPQPPTPPVTKEEIAEMAGKAASEVAARVIEAKAEEDAEQRRHVELLSAIRSGMATQPVAGYKEDAYRFLGQGISAAAAAVERKEPIKIILQGVPQVLSAISPAPPGPKEIAPGAAGEEMAGAVGKLKPEWVVAE